MSQRLGGAGGSTSAPLQAPPPPPTGSHSGGKYNKRWWTELQLHFQLGSRLKPTAPFVFVLWGRSLGRQRNSNGAVSSRQASASGNHARSLAASPAFAVKSFISLPS